MAVNTKPDDPAVKRGRYTPLHIWWRWGRVVGTIATTRKNVEAEPGIEPGLADLQSGA